MRAGDARAKHALPTNGCRTRSFAVAAAVHSSQKTGSRLPSLSAVGWACLRRWQNQGALVTAQRQIRDPRLSGDGAERPPALFRDGGAPPSPHPPHHYLTSAAGGTWPAQPALRTSAPTAAPPLVRAARGHRRRPYRFGCGVVEGLAAAVICHASA